jgi:hypothetical protein
MAKRKSARPRRNKLPAGTEHVTLALCIVRAEVLRGWMMTTAEQVIAREVPHRLRDVEALVRLEITPTMQLSVGMQSYTSALYVAVEAWRRGHFVDPEIDRLLSDIARIADLKECRDKVFHAGDATDPIAAFHPSKSDRVPWAVELHKALLRYSRDHFSDWSEEDRRQVIAKLEGMDR